MPFPSQLQGAVEKIRCFGLKNWHSKIHSFLFFFLHTRFPGGIYFSHLFPHNQDNQIYYCLMRNENIKNNLKNNKRALRNIF